MLDQGPEGWRGGTGHGYWSARGVIWGPRQATYMQVYHTSVGAADQVLDGF